MGPKFQGLLSALCGMRYPLVGPDSLQTYFSCHNWIENCGLGNSRLLAQVSQLSTGSVKTASASFSVLGGGTMAKRPALLCSPLVALFHSGSVKAFSHFSQTASNWPKAS